jgi:tRNA-dihydrouridine synthase
MEVSEVGEEHALPQMRKHFAWYTHGLPQASKLRNHIFRLKKFSEIQKIFSGYQEIKADHKMSHF